MRKFVAHLESKDYHPEGAGELAGLYEVKGEYENFSTSLYNKLCGKVYDSASAIAEDIAKELGCKVSNVRVSFPKQPSAAEMKYGF